MKVSIQLMHVSRTSSFAIFCLDWMNAGSIGKTLSNAILFYKVMISNALVFSNIENHVKKLAYIIIGPRRDKTCLLGE